LIKDFYELTKPGIVYGNALTALAGYAYGAAQHFDTGTCLLLAAGLACIVASACVVNNYFDRSIDARMERTKARALPGGRVSARAALLFAGALLAAGIFLLAVFVNMLTLAVSLVGWLIYVAAYTPLKRVSEHAVLVGALAGAVPPVAGYTGSTNALDSTALILFLMLLSWQMVHFCAIALYRLDEYRAAGIPVFPLRQGAARTKALMAAYAFIFLLCLVPLALIGRVRESSMLLLGMLAVGWLCLTLWGFRSDTDRAWARANFFYSLVILLGFCAAIALS